MMTQRMSLDLSSESSENRDGLGTGSGSESQNQTKVDLQYEHETSESLQEDITKTRKKIRSIEEELAKICDKRTLFLPNKYAQLARYNEKIKELQEKLDNPNITGLEYAILAGLNRDLVHYVRMPNVLPVSWSTSVCAFIRELHSEGKDVLKEIREEIRKLENEVEKDKATEEGWNELQKETYSSLRRKESRLSEYKRSASSSAYASANSHSLFNFSIPHSEAIKKLYV